MALKTTEIPAVHAIVTATVTLAIPFTVINVTVKTTPKATLVEECRIKILRTHVGWCNVPNVKKDISEHRPLDISVTSKCTLIIKCVSMQSL